jgi:hypothetical protein
MNTELKKAILNFILDNQREYQIINSTVTVFKPYIYDSNGEYLLGGKEVYQFIKDAINLLLTK